MGAIGRVLDGKRGPAATCTGLDDEETLGGQTLISALDEPDGLHALAARAVGPCITYPTLSLSGPGG